MELFTVIRRHSAQRFRLDPAEQEVFIRGASLYRVKQVSTSVIKVSYCDNCGLLLPGGAAYCPYCGARVERKLEVAMAGRESLVRILQAGVLGAFFSVMISSFSPQNINMYFIPSFLSSLLTIFMSRSKRLDEAVTVSLAVYLFADAILAGIALGSLYIQDVPLADLYGNYVPTLVDVIMYTVSPITAVVAGYIGVRLSARTRAAERPPIAYRREEEPGGVIYSLKREPEESLASTPHKV